MDKVSLEQICASYTLNTVYQPFSLFIEKLVRKVILGYTLSWHTYTNANSFFLEHSKCNFESEGIRKSLNKM